VTVSEALKEMASIAWNNQIKGSSLKRNSLLVPIAILFDQIRRQQPILDSEALRAASIEKIFDHLDRISEKGRGQKARAATEAITNHFFHTLLQENYRDKTHHLIRDEKDIKSAYLFYLRSHIGKKES
jgi:CRISPR-associated protein Csc3